MRRSLCLLAGLVSFATRAHAQQVADASFSYRVAKPAYVSRGPLVLIDEAHNNFHTIDGRYGPFASLLRADGYVVAAGKKAFSKGSLGDATVLVIANAMGGRDFVSAYESSAFTDAECDVIVDWVRQGGSLLLIADHAPYGTGARVLGEKFGVQMSRGFTEDPGADTALATRSLITFTRAAGQLGDHAIIRGRDSTERVNRVTAFTGQSLLGPPGSIQLLRLAPTAIDHPPPTSRQAAASPQPGAVWRDVRGKPVHSAAGRAMALAFSFGRGRVVVFGEAAMASAQVQHRADGSVHPMGMNVPGNDNAQFVLNTLRWLTGALSGE